jgi:hypothetical protein
MSHHVPRQSQLVINLRSKRRFHCVHFLSSFMLHVLDQSMHMLHYTSRFQRKRFGVSPASRSRSTQRLLTAQPPIRVYRLHLG